MPARWDHNIPFWKDRHVRKRTRLYSGLFLSILGIGHLLVILIKDLQGDAAMMLGLSGMVYFAVGFSRLIWVRLVFLFGFLIEALFLI